MSASPQGGAVDTRRGARPAQSTATGTFVSCGSTGTNRLAGRRLPTSGTSPSGHMNRRCRIAWHARGGYRLAGVAWPVPLLSVRGRAPTGTFQASGHHGSLHTNARTSRSCGTSGGLDCVGGSDVPFPAQTARREPDSCHSVSGPPGTRTLVRRDRVAPLVGWGLFEGPWVGAVPNGAMGRWFWVERGCPRASGVAARCSPTSSAAARLRLRVAPAVLLVVRSGEKQE